MSQTNYPEVHSVMFLANINIDGRMGNNLEAARDGVDLYWHEATGGLIVGQGGKQHYVSPQSIMSLTLKGKVTTQDARYVSPTASVPPAPLPAEPNGLADKVLAEFSTEQDAMPQPKPKRVPTVGPKR